MLEAGLRYLRNLRGFAQINLALARGQASRATRVPVMEDTRSWEFCGFSQNGEDGILDVLVDRIREPNRYFIEIGSSNGLENNTSWLSLVRRYSGLWIEADSVLAARSAELFGPLNHGVQVLSMALTPDNAAEVARRSLVSCPDVLSLDIDSYDYYAAAALLRSELRPRICVVEYNSALGPDATLAVPYPRVAAGLGGSSSKLYYGCSIAAWKRLFSSAGYVFLTVERNGVNAFFVDPAAFDGEFLQQPKGIDFAENYAQLVEFPGGWREQWDLISNLAFVDVSATGPART